MNDQLDGKHRNEGEYAYERAPRYRMLGLGLGGLVKHVREFLIGFRKDVQEGQSNEKSTGKAPNYAHHPLVLADVFPNIGEVAKESYF